MQISGDLSMSNTHRAYLYYLHQMHTDCEQILGVRCLGVACEPIFLRECMPGLKTGPFCVEKKTFFVFLFSCFK